GAGPGGRRAGRVGAGGGGAGRRGAADQHRGAGCLALAGCRGGHHAPGAGLGDGPRPGGGAAAGGRARTLVGRAGPAARRVPAAGRAGRVRRAGQRPVVHRAVLGRLRGVFSFDLAGALRHFTALRDAVGPGPSGALADALAGRARALLDLGQYPEAAEDARRSLAITRELGYPSGEVLALVLLAYAAAGVGDLGEAVRLGPAGPTRP